MYDYDFEDRRYYVENKLGYLQATVDFALKREELKKSFMEYILSLDIMSNDKKERLENIAKKEIAVSKK